MLEKNKEIARAFTAAQNENNREKLLALLSPDFKSHISDQAAPLSRDQFIQGVKMSHEAFSNLIFEIVDMVAEGDKVALRLIARGKHTGTYQGHLPTHKNVKFAGLAIRRIVEGKVVEEWQTNDQLSLLKQIS